MVTEIKKLLRKIPNLQAEISSRKVEQQEYKDVFLILTAATLPIIPILAILNIPDIAPVVLQAYVLSLITLVALGLHNKRALSNLESSQISSAI